MKLSTRSRYGLRLMLALAKNYGKGNLLLKDIAGQEGISEKYLSLIVIPLKSAGLINSARGFTGGYTLARDPSQITLKEIIDLLEGEVLLDCLKNPAICPRSTSCASRDIWSLLNDRIAETLNSITLGQLVEMSNEKGNREETQRGFLR